MSEQGELMAIIQELWAMRMAGETTPAPVAAREILRLRKRVAELEEQIEDMHGDAWERGSQP